MFHFLDSSWHNAAWGEDTSISLGSKSAIGRQVVVKLGGTPETVRHGVLHGFDKTVIEDKLYKMLMTLSYSDYVRPHCVWHILRLYHRVYMASASTEALAELIGSMLTQRVQCQVGRHASLADCIGSTKLRCAGIRGNPRDVGFITRSLNIYFRGKAWHFFISARSRAARAKKFPGGLLGPSMALHRHELCSRVQRNFSWIEGTLAEALRVFGRRNLRLDLDASGASGFVRLRSAKSLHDLMTILREAQARYEPDVVDPRVWKDLCLCHMQFYYHKHVCAHVSMKCGIGAVSFVLFFWTAVSVQLCATVFSQIVSILYVLHVVCVVILRFMVRRGRCIHDACRQACLVGSVWF